VRFQSCFKKKLLLCYRNVPGSQTAKIKLKNQSTTVLKNFFFLHEFFMISKKMVTVVEILLIILRLNMMGHTINAGNRKLLGKLFTTVLLLDLFRHNLKQ